MTETGTEASTGARPRVGVSSCLLGEPVRFNGGHSRSRFLTDELGPHVDWAPYCPEMEIGLGAPRETLRLTADGRLVSKSGADHTAAMAALPLPAALDGYVFKAKSPSCAIHGVARFGESGQPGRPPGPRRVRAAGDRPAPLLPAEDEGRLSDPVLREEFTERSLPSPGSVSCSRTGGRRVTWLPSTPGTSSSCSRTTRRATGTLAGSSPRPGARPGRRPRPRTGTCSPRRC